MWKQNLSITDNVVTRVFKVSEIQARNQGGAEGAKPP